MTPQMLTLGRDGSDFDDNEQPRHNSSNTAASSSSWWNRVLLGRPQEEKKESSSVAYYRSLEEETKESEQVDSKNNHARPRGLRQSLLTMKDTAVDGNVELNNNNNTVITREDVLEQDCDFFYRGLETNTTTTTPRRLRAVRYSSEQHSFQYRDAVDVLTPPFLQYYRTKYQQLNQEMENNNDTSRYDHDLVLVEGDVQNIVRTDTVEHSTIFYQTQDGRLLMRLPRDQVRLIMDPDLEAGILSVEQWRQNNDKQDAPLQYVLTVQDDLYKRIVAEMSDAVTKPYCGLSHCCNENEKVDIRVAIVLLAVILLILLINTFIWPVE